MKRQRKSVPELSETIHTERFLLKPVGKIRSVQLFTKMQEDAEILRQLTHSDRRANWWKLFRTRKLPNHRSRFVHEIVDSENGGCIGYHEVRLYPYKSASLGVVILDRDWWGQAVPVEVRLAIMAQFARHAGVERFVGNVASRNFASILNYKKLGFKHSGTTHRSNFDTIAQQPVDYFSFELLKEDFPAHWHETKA